MDPNDSIRRAIIALADHEWTAYQRAISDYVNWRRRGGFQAKAYMLDLLELAHDEHVPEDLRWGQTPAGWAA